MKMNIESFIRIMVGARAIAWRWPLSLVLLAASLMSCRSTQNLDGQLARVGEGVTLGPCSLGAPCAFAMAAPAALTPAALLLSTTSSLQIDDRVTLKETGSGLPVIANLGTGLTQIGTDGKLGDIWSNGRVTIADRTVVSGTIHGAVTIVPGNNVVIKGKDPKAFQTVTTTSTITFPTTNSGDVDVEPGVTSPLAAGAYGSVVVKTNGRLNLAAGSYLMDSLDLEPSGKLALDTSGGPVRLYVRNSVILRGTITSTSDARDLTLVYFGSAELFVEAPLNATVIASIAKINLRSVSPLTGAFFGKSIEVGPGDTVTHVGPRTPVVPTRNGRIEAETFDANSGGQNEGSVVDGLSGGSWLLFRGVNFGTAGQFNRIRFNLLSPSGIDEVVVRLDSPTGQVAADLQTLPTGPDGYIVESAALSPGITGVHDTYVAVNGTEEAGVDWLELYKGPSRKIVTSDAPRLPPDAGFPDVTPTPDDHQEDAPQNAFWLNLPQNVQIPANGADGFQVNPTASVTLMAQVRWTGGPGPVEILLFDGTPTAIPPTRTETLASDGKVITVWAGLVPGQLNLVVRNNGNTPVTINTLAGFVPAQ